MFLLQFLNLLDKQSKSDRETWETKKNWRVLNQPEHTDTHTHTYATTFPQYSSKVSIQVGE